MSSTLQGADVVAAVRRVSQMLIEQRDYLTSLDQAMGDGDMGITMGKIGEALLAFADAVPIDDIGKYLFQLGTATNKAAPSTMGTLTAGALMSAGKVVRDRTELEPGDLVAMFQAADEGIQSRGKAKLGDKTIVDALHPACEAFSAASAAGSSLNEAGAAAIEAATAGRDSVTPLRSKIGRASWVGERTEGIVDPGCAMFVLVLKAIAG
jgi:phosphoenolpyruvate---glycerone phosphotransferase subunit DhaL